MGIFTKKVDVRFDPNTFHDTPEGRRKLNVVMDLANSLIEEDPDLALELIAGVKMHPDLHKIRGWAYAEKEELPKALEEFQNGFDLGNISCGVYLHRLLRDFSDDEDRFQNVETQLLPYLQSRNVSFMYAQARLALRKKDFVSAITNMISIMHEKDQATVDLFGGSFFSAFRLLSLDFAEKETKDLENPTEDELERSWNQINNFFENELKTSDGNSLEWDPFLYFFMVAEYLFREIEEGNYRSASILDEFNDLYVDLIQQLDPPEPPKTFSKDFIWEVTLKSLEKGDLYSILMARSFAKVNGFPVSEIKRYEDEFTNWGLRKYV